MTHPEELRALVEALKEALEPFANGDIDISGSAVIIGYPQASEALRRARTALTRAESLLSSVPDGGWDTEIEYEIWSGDAYCAGSSSLADAQHYAMVYGQDGPTQIIKAVTYRSPLPASPQGSSENG